MITEPIRIDSEAIYTLAIASRATGLSRDTLKLAIKRNSLKATKRGRDWFIKGDSLKAYLVHEPETAMPKPK